MSGTQLIRTWLTRLGYKVSRLPAEHQYHVYDYADMKFILAEIATPLIIDIGANVGETIDRFRRLIPAARILRAEANWSLWERLAAKYHQVMTVCPEPAAAGYRFPGHLVMIWRTSLVWFK